MTYRGHIKNGSVIFDEPLDPPLPEGTPVSVEPAPRPVPLSELFKDIIGKATDLPSDGSTQHDHYIYGTPKR